MASTGRSKNERIEFVQTGDEPFEFIYGYDPRVCWIEDRYYVTWCNAYDGWPTIGVGYTHDFETFYQMENAFLPYNRNGVLFPRKVGGRYAMLSRPATAATHRSGTFTTARVPIWYTGAAIVR